MFRRRSRETGVGHVTGKDFCLNTWFGGMGSDAGGSSDRQC